MLQTGQIVSGRGSGYVVVVPPGVRHLPELLSVTESTFFHGDMRTRKVAGVREIFGVPVILTNINLIKLNKIIFDDV